MKIFRPLTYVVAAAAMCILCFSGNGNYIHVVCNAAAENDIVEQPDNQYSERILSKEKIQNSRIKRYVQLYISKCLSQYYSEKESFGKSETPCDTSFIGLQNTENDKLYKQILIGLPGNRSP